MAVNYKMGDPKVWRTIERYVMDEKNINKTEK